VAAHIVLEIEGWPEWYLSHCNFESSSQAKSDCPLFAYTKVRYPSRIDLSFHPGYSDDSMNWRCWLVKPAETHVVGVCAARTPLKAQRLVVRKSVPLAFEAPLEFELLGQSPD
jgi:hypothetical protein